MLCAREAPEESAQAPGRWTGGTSVPIRPIWSRRRRSARRSGSRFDGRSREWRDQAKCEVERRRGAPRRRASSGFGIAGAGSKLEKARSLNIPVIDEAGLLVTLDETVAAGR